VLRSVANTDVTIGTFIYISDMLPLRPVHLSIAIRNVSQVERRLVRRQTIGSLALHAYFAKLCPVMRSDFCPGGHQGTSVETSILANATTLSFNQTNGEHIKSLPLVMAGPKYCPFLRLSIYVCPLCHPNSAVYINHHFSLLPTHLLFVLFLGLRSIT
jgi:hypothetical protein